MELKHYTLSQLLTTYANDSTIVVRVEPGYAVEFKNQKGLQVKGVANELLAVVPPSEFSNVSKRLYKMRFKSVWPCSVHGTVYKFEASIRETVVTVTVVKEAAVAAPCVSLDLSKEEAPVIAISVAEPVLSANEDQPKEDLKSYSLENIISPYDAGYLQSSFELRIDFSSWNKLVGVEKYGFVCSPNVERVIRDLVPLKTSASNEMCDVFNDMKGLKFVSAPTRVDEISSFIATKGATTIRVAVLKVKESHTPEPVEQAPKTMKEAFISWWHKILS